MDSETLNIVHKLTKQFVIYYWDGYATQIDKTQCELLLGWIYKVFPNVYENKTIPTYL